MSHGPTVHPPRRWEDDGDFATGWPGTGALASRRTRFRRRLRGIVCRVWRHRWAEAVRSPDGPLVQQKCRNGCGCTKSWTVY